MNNDFDSLLFSPRNQRVPRHVIRYAVGKLEHPTTVIKENSFRKSSPDDCGIESKPGGHLDDV